MAKKRRRKNKNQKNNIILIVMLCIIFVIIAIFAFDSMKTKTPTDGTSSTDDVFVDNTQSADSNNSDDGDSQSSGSDSSTQPTDSESTTEEPTTEPETLPLVQESQNVSNIVIDYYTDYMGFPKGALFIRESETKETATGYTFTLRLNLNGSPNELIGDVYVEKGTGKVTDSMGNASWNISN